MPGTPNTAIASITDWSCQLDAENYECTSLGMDWRTYIPGLRGWQGRVTGFYNLVTDTTGQLQLFNALVGGNSVALQMQTAAGGGYFEGTANITQCSVADSVKALITIDFNYVGNGSLQHLP